VTDQSPGPVAYQRDFPIGDFLRPPWDVDDPAPRITGVRAIVTAPEGVNLVVVRIDTDAPGLHGYGCATFAHRAAAVASVVTDYLAPRLVGRGVADITDITATLASGPYWRGGPIGNSTLSGIDMALWDIAGRRAGVPVWALIGGRVRRHLSCYTTVYGHTEAQLLEELGRRIASGEHAFRPIVAATEQPGRVVPDPPDQLATIRELLRRLRSEFGNEIDLIVDLHGQLRPPDVIRLADEIAPLRPFYFEDPLAIEDLGWMPTLRAHTDVPLATGELFTSVADALPLLTDRSIDFLRCHLSTIGGFTPALRLAAACELFGVRTAWHGPADCSPIGHAANVALGTASEAFGIHEHHEPGAATRETFQGAPTASAGVVWPTTRPGWGIEVDEAAAASYPPIASDRVSGFEGHRRHDGSIQRP
jgi:mannonate dehydratase